jgi:hypothetical protein
MDPEISDAAFDALLARSGLLRDGLELTEAQRAELRRGHAALARMLARLRRDRPRADEPAHIFVAGTFE